MDEELIMKYLAHECTSDELKEIERQISRDKSNAEQLFESERIWNLKNEICYSDEKVIEKAYQRLISTVGMAESVSSRGRRRSIVKVRLWWQLGAAAVIAILLVMNLLRPVVINESPDIVWNSIHVPHGQRADVTLSDGTKVSLNSATTLRYPGRFTEETRCVKLEGEGYFEVAHDEAHPFIVNTEKINVKVLGTIFNLKAYPFEQIEVTLAKGKVEVESSDHRNKITMRPNERILYSEVQGMVLQQGLNTDLLSAWTKGEAAYINKPLADICADLERRYNVQIKIENADLAKVVFTCHLKENTTIEQVMNLLKGTHKLNYRIRNKEIHIINP